MNDTLVTVQGNLGGDLVLRTAGESLVANFRLACTPSRYDRQSGVWVHEETQWYDVVAWRALAEHCERSLRRGDPVLVHGRLRQRSYTNRDGAEVRSMEVTAAAIGHDLSRGTTVFSRADARPSAASEGGQQQEAGAGAEETVAA